jgi:hypothetical protein
LLLVVVESSVYENYLKAKNELQNVGKVSFLFLISIDLSSKLSYPLLLILEKSFLISSGHSKLRFLVGMSFLNQLTYIVFFILPANTRRCK